MMQWLSALPTKYGQFSMFMTRDFSWKTLQTPKYRISLGAPYLFFSSSFWLRLRSRPAFLATNWQGHETELFGWSSEKS